MLERLVHCHNTAQHKALRLANVVCHFLKPIAGAARSGRRFLALARAGKHPLDALWESTGAFCREC